MEDVGFKSGENCFLARSNIEYHEMAEDLIGCGDYNFDDIRQNGIDFIANNHTYVHRMTELLEDLK
jgi:hypothetical protein